MVLRWGNGRGLLLEDGRTVLSFIDLPDLDDGVGEGFKVCGPGPSEDFSLEVLG